jgi:capsular polysaccharide biosynthesis protein
VELQHSLRTLWRWIIVILAAGAVAGVLAYIASSVIPRAYESRATLLVGQGLDSARLDYTQILAAQLQAQTYAAIATARSILETTVETLGLDTTPEELARRTRAEAPSGSRFVEIIAVDRDPQRAADIANAIADYMIALTAGSSSDENLAKVSQDLTAAGKEVASAQAELKLLSQQSPTPAGNDRASALGKRLISLRSTRADLLARAGQLAQASQGSTSPITIMSDAAPSDEPTSPRPMLNAVLAAIVGILLAIVLVLAVDRRAPAEASPRSQA